MIEPTHWDLGRRVLYRRYDGSFEAGRIASYNDHYVFVLYDGWTHPAATRRDQLEWEYNNKESLNAPETPVAEKGNN